MKNENISDPLTRLRTASAEYVGVLRRQIEEIERTQRVYEANPSTLDVVLRGAHSLTMSVSDAVGNGRDSYMGVVDLVKEMLQAEEKKR